MLDCASAVFDEGQRECGLALQVFAAFPANDDPAPTLGEGCVMLEQHRLADAAKASQSDVAREDRESGEVLVKSCELGGPVRQVRWVQSHSGSEWVDARGRMITFWLHHLLSIAGLAWRNSARSRSSPPITSSRLSKVTGPAVSGSPASAPSTSSSRSASRRSTTRWTCR